jgi:glyoxylase-like metal-dependent hydrolase (beta-lactamase superfamily II)
MKRMITVLAITAVAAALAGCERKELDRTGLVQVGTHTWAMIASGPTPVEGLGANSGFVVGRTGVVVIDSRYTPALATELVGKIRTVTDAPILYVVNTHYHQDHTWGNSVFEELGAVLMAHAETRDAFIKYSPMHLDYYRERGGETFELLRDIRFAAPETLFTETAKLDLGGVSVELRHFGPGHTAGDAVVVVPKDRVVFTGGLLTNGYHPNLGDPGADFDTWLATLDRLKGLGARWYVPGAGRVCGPGAIDRNIRYIRELRKICIDAIKKRLPLEKVVQNTAIPETEGWLQPNVLPFNIQAVYRREIPEIVNPPIALDIPSGMAIIDGGGNPKAGYIRWGSQSREGYLEIEVQWKPSASVELITADITEAIMRYERQRERMMTIDGTRRFDTSSGPVIGASGTWRAGSTIGDSVAGLWTWRMMLRSNTVYVVQCWTDAAGDMAKAKRNIDALELIAETFRVQT